VKKAAPLLLAIAVGATSGLLGAWWPRDAVEQGAPENVAAPELPSIAPGIAAVAGPLPAQKKPARVELALFCAKAAVKGDISFRRFEQSTLARKWSPPSTPLATDAQGQAVLPLTAGIYLLTARAPGCASLHQSFELKAGMEQQSLELFLDKGRAVTGTIRDATNQQPVGGALISIRQQLGLRSNKQELSADDDAWTAIADSLGRYRVEGVGEGDFVVRASAEGYADEKTALKLAGQDGRAELALQPNGFIEGLVRPLTGAATVKDLRDDARTVFVNADGAFRLAVGPGDHLLLGEDASGATGMVRVNVPAKGTVRGVELKLDRGGKIRGTASLGGAPAVCARVWIRAESDPYEIASAQVVADGTFTLERVPPGRYWLFGECADGERGDVLGVEPNRAEPVELTLKQAAGLLIRVTDGVGKPVIGAELEISQPSREPITAVTDAQGNAELGRLLPAVVNVEAKAGTREAASRKVQLVEGQVVSVELSVVETGSIAGRIDGPAGEVEGINAYSKWLDWGKHERVGPSGTFELRLLPGHYKVFPWLKGYQGMGLTKEIDVVANQQVRVDFVVTKTKDHALEASAPGTIGASFDDGPGGVSISWVISGSPVDKAGLKQGDLMIAIDGKPLQRSVDAFNRTKGAPGSAVRIAYRRSGADAEVVVTRAGGTEF
jgi:hypothetical protein